MPWKMWCPVCGFEFLNTQMKRRWDGVWVCRDDWEPRHPQDTIRVRPDKQSVPYSSPEPPDVFVEYPSSSEEEEPESYTLRTIFQDPSCVALWRFEPEDIFADSKSTNTLYDYSTDPLVNSPDSRTAVGDYKEGTGSAHCDLDDIYAAGFAIDDEGMTSDFPIKSDNASDEMSFTWWMKPDYVSQDSVEKLFYKGVGLTGTCICVYYGLNGTPNSFTILLGYSSTYKQFVFDAGLQNGNWYHCALCIKSSTRTLTMRVWDDTAGTYQDFSGVLGGDLRKTTPNPLIVNYFVTDNTIDEFAVFNRVLTTDEIDTIRNTL